ncbi:hypothetical protein EVAR_37212_1 [Eumeta japonica]|uniref:Uncharacterized protein n=1 Tax=Eumeta variegata TaxID=151549 RepID=A0A4C1Y5C6_EUMVA|nr:hypothetical protein EVAR_37212_1 [Eumeta japonica]
MSVFAGAAQGWDLAVKPAGLRARRATAPAPSARVYVRAFALTKGFHFLRPHRTCSGDSSRNFDASSNLDTRQRVKPSSSKGTG